MPRRALLALPDLTRRAHPSVGSQHCIKKFRNFSFADESPPKLSLNCDETSPAESCPHTTVLFEAGWSNQFQ